MTRRRALGCATAIVCLAPAAWLAWCAASGDLGANPIEAVEHTTGAWALRLLLATLAVTPLRRLTGWQAIGTQRRTLGRGKAGQGYLPARAVHALPGL